MSPAEIAVFGSFAVSLVVLVVVERRGGRGLDGLWRLLLNSAAVAVAAFVVAIAIAIADASGAWETVRNVCRVIWGVWVGALAAWLLVDWRRKRRRPA